MAVDSEGGCGERDRDKGAADVEEQLEAKDCGTRGK